MVYINKCIDVNAAFKKFLQIYELFGLNQSVSKKFPTLASTRLYLDIFFQIYGHSNGSLNYLGSLESLTKNWTDPTCAIQGAKVYVVAAIVTGIFADKNKAGFKNLT
jgi:hypothetical protein